MTAETPIRVVVVDDSALARGLIVKLLTQDPAISVIGTASDGRSAVDLVQRLRPDVVTMDVRMPVLDGLAATELLMAYCPTPILVLTSALDSYEVDITFRMLQAGALEVVEKPAAALPAAERAARDLIRRVKTLSRVKVVTHLRGRRRSGADPLLPPPVIAATGDTPVIVLGASTGGPRVIHRILADLPAQFGATVLIAQHIADGFGSVMTGWLNGAGPLRVQLAAEGMALKAGSVLVVPDRSELRFDPQSAIRLVPAEGDGPTPSIDALMRSVASFGSRAVGVLLTGMGRDGAVGMADIRRAGGHTIAQDEQTSAIFGMPRAAIEIGAASEVLSAEAIGPRLVQLCGALVSP